MYNIETLKSSILQHMESIGLINEKKCVSKANTVLSVAKKLNINEAEEYLLEEAFETLEREDKIRSNFNKYDDNGKLIKTVISVKEEGFYLNK